MTPKTNYFHVWRHQETSNDSIKSRSIFKVVITLRNIKVLEIQNVENCEKKPAPISPDGPSNEFLKILEMAHIYQRT